MSTDYDGWAESREGTTHVTLTRPQTRAQAWRAALAAYLTPAAIVVAVLLVVGTFLDLPDAALAGLSVAGVAVVYTYGARDIRRARRVHRS